MNRTISLCLIESIIIIFCNVYDMALLAKLFSTKKRSYNSDSEIQDRFHQINTEQVRLLLFKECDWRGRKLLFDSSTIKKVPAEIHDEPAKHTDAFPCIVEVSEGFSYVYNGPAPDASVLSEMIFGAVAITHKGVSLKFHIMDDPKRLMCTKVFIVPSVRRAVRDDKAIDVNSTEVNAASNLLNVPSYAEEGVSLSFSLDRGDSGFYCDQSIHSSLSSTHDYFSIIDTAGETLEDNYSFHSPTARKLSTSSNGSWQRRTYRSLSTRFDIGYQNSNLLSVPSIATSASNVTSCDSQIYNNSSSSGTTDSLASGSSTSTRRKTKLGLALLVTAANNEQMDLIRKCLEQSSQLQALVCRLRLATMAAGAGSGYVATLYRAAVNATTWLSDLLYGPRVQSVWLSMVTSDHSRNATKMADNLVSDLCTVLSIADTKSTNFFISTLLTHVLTYHLGWVTTVSPYDSHAPNKQWSRSPFGPGRSYNALWAQIGDLCGSIGFPQRAAKTIISGSTNIQFINRLLAVLTYFMRCGDVSRTEYEYKACDFKENKLIINTEKKSETHTKLDDVQIDCVKVPFNYTQSSESSLITLVSTEVSLKRSVTLANLTRQLSTTSELNYTSTSNKSPDQFESNPTLLLPMKPSLDASLNSSVSHQPETESKVVFVLGEDEQLVGLKNKSNGGKSVKRSSKVHSEMDVLELGNVIESVKDTNSDKFHRSFESPPRNISDKTFEKIDNPLEENIEKMKVKEQCYRNTESPSKCCAQTLQHSKPIKHSGFKFEFDKYPQIVTNYMKSRNLEILDRHYLGKPGNLNLHNFQFDPTIVPPIQEERCDICCKRQLMESTLQTPSNASELEYMNDFPRQLEPQFAQETVVEEYQPAKTFIRKRKENTIIVNVTEASADALTSSTKGTNVYRVESKKAVKEDVVEVKRVVEIPLARLWVKPVQAKSEFDLLLGGITDHYVPDLILQGTTAKPTTWESELRRDLELTAYMSRNTESPVQTIAIIGDTNTWCVRVVGKECGWSGVAGGMSALVSALLDAFAHMRRARVPSAQCLHFIESKLREFCILSKTLADMLMSTDFCDMNTLTETLNVDVNDVPLLLAIATTHTPQVATRYGISYR